jgi:hypothetical protein
MTPRTIESIWQLDLNLTYSELLLREAQKKSPVFNLSQNIEVFDVLHPKLIKVLKETSENPQLTPETLLYPTFATSFFPQLADATAAMPGAKVVRGLPYEVGLLLAHQQLPLIMDFAPIGTVIFSQEPLNHQPVAGVHLHLLPAWLNYAMSPELWGPQGKWTRFHQRLLDLFNNKQLLTKAALPGHYCLHPDASKLEKLGFSGSLESDCYSLTLPWSFPLSALVELERIVSQEF